MMLAKVDAVAQEYLLKAEIPIPEGAFTTDPMGNQSSQTET